MTSYKIHGHFYRELIFWVGILSTLCYRAIIFLNHLPNSFWSDLVWYLGTLGFIWYFAHRYQVEKTRADIVAERQLDHKVERGDTLSADDKRVLVQTLRGLELSKAKWIYIVIFVSSGIALLIDIFVRLLDL